MNQKVTIRSTLKNAYSGISKEMWILGISMLINRSGSMVLILMSLYLTIELHYSIPEAGVVMMMFGLGSLVGSYLGGRLVDKMSFYPIMIWSLVFSGAMIIILGLVHNYYLILLFTFLVTAIGDMFRPANQASIRLYSSKENYTQSIALNRLAMNLGFTVGPMLGGFIASISYKFIFWADGVTCIFAALFLWLKLPYKKAENTSKTITEKDSVPFSRSPYRDKHYLLFILFTMIYALVFFQLLTTMSLYYENEYHLSERKIGTLLAVNGIGVAVVEMFLIYYIQNRWSNFKFISLGTLLVICSYLILVPFHGIWVLIIGILLITMSEMLAMPFMSTFALNRSDSSNVGRYMALYSMAWSTALILAPILGTQIIHSYGFNILFISLGILALIPLLGFRWLDIQLTNENLNTES